MGNGDSQGWGILHFPLGVGEVSQISLFFGGMNDGSFHGLKEEYMELKLVIHSFIHQNL